jgi:EH domain-containing protein 1
MRMQILLMFDPHKLDISDEFKQVISTLKGHDDKVGRVEAQTGRTTTQH